MHSLRRFVGLAPLVLAPALSKAGLMDDWQTCLSTVLNRPNAQNRGAAFGEYCVGLGYMEGHFGRKDQVPAGSGVSQNQEQALNYFAPLKRKGKS